MLSKQQSTKRPAVVDERRCAASMLLDWHRHFALDQLIRVYRSAAGCCRWFAPISLCSGFSRDQTFVGTNLKNWFWSIAIMSVKAANGSIQSFLADNRHSAPSEAAYRFSNIKPDRRHSPSSRTYVPMNSVPHRRHKQNDLPRSSWAINSPSGLEKSAEVSGC